jgi:hypothetical protein
MRGPTRFEFVFQPALSSVLWHRATALMIAAMAFVQVILGWFHLPGWTCPAWAATGYPCPGCGLTRATVALLHWDLHAMARLHLFAPAALAAFAFVVAAGVLPTPMRRRLMASLETVERSTGVTMLLLVALVVYWITRLCFDRDVLVAVLMS